MTVRTQEWGPVEQLLAVAGGPDGPISAAVDEIGLDRVADVVAGEIVARCDAGSPSDGVTVRVRIGHGGRQVSHVLRFGGQSVGVAPGWAGDTDAVLDVGAVDVLRSLYGQQHLTTTANAQVIVASLTRSAEDLPREVAHAVQAVLEASAGGGQDFAALCTRSGSDKWGIVNWYAPHYDRHLGGLRDLPVRMLEIGIGSGDDPHRGGDSLRLFQRYFPRGLVYGLDLYDKPSVRGPRIRTIVGDQSDHGFMRELGRELGPFDVVVDDGSHVNEHVLTSFDALFPHVRPGGYYVIEDMFTSYQPDSGGSADDRDAPGTIVGFLKSLLDGLHHVEYAGEDYQSSYTDRHVVGVHVYRNIAFVEKGVNWEPAAWVPDRRSRRLRSRGGPARSARVGATG